MSARDAEIAATVGVSTVPDPAPLPAPELFPKSLAWVVREEGGQRFLDIIAWRVPTQVPGKRIEKATGKPQLLTKEVTNVRT